MSAVKAAKKLWDYHHMNHLLKKSDIMLVMCSHDTRVAEYAAELFKKGYASKILFTGGIAHEHDLLSTGWSKPEAEIFYDVAIKAGVPNNAILLEMEAKNCGENILFSKQLLEKNYINPTSIILLQKPYMERRAYATIKKIWPEVDAVVASPPIPFEEYPTDTIPFDTFVNIMVGASR